MSHGSIAMDRHRLERIFTHFQARARGYLLRDEVRRAREDYEDIVLEIHGTLNSLKWVQGTLHFPRFTDTEGTIFPFKIHASNPENPKLKRRVCDASLSSTDWTLNQEEDVCGRGHPEKLKAERDVSETSAFVSEAQDSLDNTDVQNEDIGVQEPVMGLACGSTTAWGSVDTEMGSCGSLKGLRQYCLARDVPRTPEALRVHRNTLSMELLWLQQAIDSRKKYLSLKKQLIAS